MRSRAAHLLSILAASAFISLAGCKQEEPSAPPSPIETEALATAEPEPMSTPSGDATGSAGGIASDLDVGALQERRDPERLLRFYTSALRVGDWSSAAKAWSLDALMTPEKLEAQFGGDAGPRLAMGKGDWSNAAGTLYYEVPVTVDFPDGRGSRRGSIVLRRANDVPGASELQLVWRIARSSTLQE